MNDANILMQNFRHLHLIKIFTSGGILQNKIEKKMCTITTINLK